MVSGFLRFGEGGREGGVAAYLRLCTLLLM